MKRADLGGMICLIMSVTQSLMRQRALMMRANDGVNMLVTLCVMIFATCQSNEQCANQKRFSRDIVSFAGSPTYAQRTFVMYFPAAR